jgi:hypothetical protein
MAGGAEKVPCRSSAPIRCLDRSRSGSAPDGCRSSADHRCTAAWRRCAQSHVYRVRDGGSKDGYGRIDATKPLENLMWRRTSFRRSGPNPFFSSRCSTLRFRLRLLFNPSAPPVAPGAVALRRESPMRLVPLAVVDRRLPRHRLGYLRAFGHRHRLPPHEIRHRRFRNHARVLRSITRAGNPSGLPMIAASHGFGVNPG